MPLADRAMIGQPSPSVIATNNASVANPSSRTSQGSGFTNWNVRFCEAIGILPAVANLVAPDVGEIGTRIGLPIRENACLGMSACLVIADVERHAIGAADQPDLGKIAGHSLGVVCRDDAPYCSSWVATVIAPAASLGA